VPVSPGSLQFARAVASLSRQLPEPGLPLREVIIYLARAGLISHVPSFDELKDVIAYLTDSDVTDVGQGEVSAALRQLAVVAVAALAGPAKARTGGLRGGAREHGASGSQHAGGSSQPRRRVTWPKYLLARLPAISDEGDVLEGITAPAPYHHRAEQVATKDASDFARAWDKLANTPELKELAAHARDHLRGLGVTFPMFIASTFAELPLSVQATRRIAYFLHTSDDGTAGRDYLIQRLNSIHNLGAQIPAPLGPQENEKESNEPASEKTLPADDSDAEVCEADLRLPPRIAAEGRLSASDAVTSLFPGDAAPWLAVERELSSRLGDLWPPVAEALAPMFDSGFIKPMLTTLTRGSVWKVPIHRGEWQGYLILDARLLRGATRGKDIEKFEFEAGSDSQTTISGSRESRKRLMAGVQVQV
jgi:hypothetical protein